MDQELFNPQSSSVISSRILYTPSAFARTSLLQLHEVGSLQAIHQHTSTRTNLPSFLCFVVLSGTGSLTYEGQTYQLGEGDCVLIDCRKAYSHSTSDDLWSLQWCHFYAPSLPAVYEKYKERGGRPVFHPADIKAFTTLPCQRFILRMDETSSESEKMFFLTQDIQIKNFLLRMPLQSIFPEKRAAQS